MAHKSNKVRRREAKAAKKVHGVKPTKPAVLVNSKGIMEHSGRPGFTKDAHSRKLAGFKHRTASKPKPGPELICDRCGRPYGEHKQHAYIGMPSCPVTVTAEIINVT